MPTPTLSDNRIETRVSLYYKWVIIELIGSRGKNFSEVLSRMLGEWIEAHEALLRKKRLTEDDFKSPRRVSQEPSAKKLRKLGVRAAGEP